MSSFLERVYDVLFQPRTAMRQIAAERPLGQAVVAVITSSVLPLWGLYLSGRTTIMGNKLGLLLAFELLTVFLLWFGKAAVLHLLTELCGGLGRVTGLLAALGFATLPRLLIIPLAVLSMLLPEELQAALLGLGVAIVVLWSVVLDILALKGTYDITSAKAISILVAPYLAFLVIAGCVVTFLHAIVNLFV